MRFAMQMAAEKETDAEREAEQEILNVETDLYKYRLKHALALCARCLPKVEKNGIHKIGDDEFSRARHLLFEKAAEYSHATHIMWSAFSGHCKVCHDQGDRYNVTFQPRFGAYGVLVTQKMDARLTATVAAAADRCGRWWSKGLPSK